MLDHQLARRLVQDVVAAALDDLAAAKDAVAVDIDPIFYRTFLAALARFFRIGGQGERHDAGILDSSRSLGRRRRRSEEHTSELQSLMRISYAVFCLKTKTQFTHNKYYNAMT